MEKKLLSLCVPVYFEEEVIQHFIDQTIAELIKLPIDFELIFVDDGSTDNTVEIIKTNCEKHPQIRLIVFSYNHGKQAAVTAAIAHAKGDYLLYMDPDLQDPPKEIARFVTEIEKGYDLVFGIRKAKKDTWINKIYSKLFWGTLNKYTGLRIPKGLAVMRIFNRDFANQFLRYKEQNRFIEGIFMHISKNYQVMEIEQHKRFAGQSKFNFKRKMQLAFDAIFDFSELPLKLAIRLGLLMSFAGIVSAIIILILKMTLIDFQAGWASLITVIILACGLQLFFIGIAAIYIGKIYKESKSRPLYSIKKSYNVE
jgi:glycosyltransferase involved in cell wall biosynthesis